MPQPKMPRMTPQEQAMHKVYDVFLDTMEHNPKRAAALALQTLELWISADQPPSTKGAAHATIEHEERP